MNYPAFANNELRFIPAKMNLYALNSNLPEAAAL